MKSFKQYITETLKQGDRVVATKNTRGGWARDMKEVPTIKKGTKGTYHGEIQGMDKGYHHVVWDNTRGAGISSGDRTGGYAHNRHEFKKLKEEKIEEKHVGFAAVEASARKSGARNPAAVAAAVGFKKYGKAKMEKAAHEGKPIKEAQSVRAALALRAKKLAQPAKKVAPKGPYSTKNASAGSFETTGSSGK